MKNILSLASKNLAFLLRKNVKLIVNCLILLAIISNLLPINTYAVDSSPSAEVQSKLESLKQEIASKAAKLKQEISTKLQNKAYVGHVKSKTESSINLASISGPKIVTINQDTVYESNIKKSKFSAKTLSEEDYIAALGDVDDTGVLTARKVILLEAPKEEQKTIIWGQILNLSNNIVIKTKQLNNITVDIGNADFQKGENSIGFNELRINDSLIVVGIINSNDILEANFIYVTPQGGFIRKESTSSAKR